MRIILARVIGVTFVLFPACSRDDGDITLPDTSGSITGTVTSSATGLPVNSAVVRTIPSTRIDTTNPTGFYILHAIAPGNYLITTVASDFRADTSSVVISSGATLTNHITLAATVGTIRGTVKWREPNTPIPAAVVSTIPQSSRDTTDSDGNYILIRIPVGSYRVVAEAQGYVSDSVQAAVSSELSVTVDVHLGAAVPTQGLIAYFPFTGNANDESGNGNHGVASGAMLAPDRTGTPDRAFTFDGWNNHIDFPDLIPDTISAFTMSSWVYTTDATNRRLALYSGSNRGEANLEIRNSRFEFHAHIYSVGWFEASSTATLGQFVHLAGVYRRGMSLQLWVNGVLMSEISIPMATLHHGSSTHSSSIGSYAPQWLDWGRQNGIQSWQGTIDQIRIYTRALSQFEVQSLYYSGQ